MPPDPYRRVAVVYDPLVERFNAALRAIGFRMAPPPEGRCVLEIGCGTGTNLRHYQDAGCAVTGLDLSPAMLAVARGKLRPRTPLHRGDAARLPYADGRFDLVIAMLTLHEMPRAIRSAVMDEIRRVLKPRGRLLLTDFHPGPLRFPKGYGVKPFIMLIERMAGRDHFRNYRDFIAGGGLPPLIAGRGLQVVRQKIVSGGNLALILLEPSAAASADG